MRARTKAAGFVCALGLACGAAPTGAPPKPSPSAGFLLSPARDVTLNGKPFHLDAEARLFFDYVPADHDASHKPIFLLSNGFSARIVRGFGTGPFTVAEDGSIAPNAASLTSVANLVYISPRQSDYSFDTTTTRAPSLALDCGANVFNEYVDAADTLFAAFAFLGAHPELVGPVYWVGESYAGVRVTWALAFLRGRFDLAPYDDPALKDAIARRTDLARWKAGQILLEPWLLGRAHYDALQAACEDRALAQEVGAALGVSCDVGACACADQNGRSRYNYDYSVARQAAREMDAATAHVTEERARLLFGVPLDAMTDLARRHHGFKCDPPDRDAPSDAALVSLFGALPRGQSYFLPFSPLEPDKAIDKSTPDWIAKDLVGAAFLDNLASVPTLVTEGGKDLVVPTRALPAAIDAVLGDGRAVRDSPTRISVKLDSGPASIDVRVYPSAGHMVTMLAADDFSRDVAAWVGALDRQR